MSIRIVLADDHRLLRAGIKTLLNGDPSIEVVGEATTGGEALDVTREMLPDILLLDIGMSGNENLEALRQVLIEVPKTKVLLLTMHEDSALLQECLRAGASGYIIKRAAESELVDAIYAVQRGIIYIHPSLMASLVNPAQEISAKTTRQKQPLTSREIDVLKLIVQGYTSKQIAEALTLSTRTVETHRSNIMEKLDLHTRVDLVRYASQHNLLGGK